MVDVAREAGVSGQTVSRVSNGKSNVDTATRARVIAAMERLGYRPNGAARALRSGRFHNLGVVMFNLASYGSVRTLQGIANSAAAAGYAITLMPLEYTSSSDLRGAFYRLGEQAVDGIIIAVQPHELDGAELSLPPGVPVVVVDSEMAEGAHLVDGDQTHGARAATRHLLDLGHATVWHISGPPRTYSSVLRREAWEATLRASGAVVPPVLVGDWTADTGYRHGLELAKNPEVTAIFAANDQTALGVLRALHESGRSVPGRVSVVGFDDMDEAANFWPPLTTVRQNLTEVGSRLVETLLLELEGRTPEGRMVATELIVRSSTGRLPAP